MKSIVTWFEIFSRSWEDANNKALIRILKDAPAYLQNVAETDKETVLEKFFDKKKGLFKFIETILEKQEVQTVLFSHTLEAAFRVLQFTIEFFKQNYEPYIMQTRDICFCCIRIHSSFNTRKTASETLKKLMKFFQNYEMKLHEIIQDCKEESVLYIVFGAIARYYPKTRYLDEKIDSIFLQLLYDLQSESNLPPRKQKEEVIIIYLECLFDMLINFVPIKNNSNSFYFERLYAVLLLYCDVNKSPEIINEILNILNTHMQYFSSFIFNDYEKWDHFLNILYKNNSIYKAIDVLKNFYKIISSYLLDENKDDVFMYFKNYFMTKINNTKLSPNDLGLIIFGLGQLSNAYNKYSPNEINEIFQTIAHQALLFSSRKEDEDKNIQILPNYLQALTEILKYISNVSVYQLNIIIKLSVLNIKRFAELKARNQTNAINALKNTFFNIKRLEKNLQRQYFHSIFYEGTLWSCSHALFVDVELQQEIKNLSEYPLCYKNYLPLWHSLLRTENYEREFIEQIFYELVSVLILFIDKLNLNVKPQQNKFLSDTSLSLKAENEADFRYFINLVDLYTNIFEEINIDLLQNHVERILKCFIKSSYKYPMVSGFYKLIKVIFLKQNVFLDYQIRFTKFTCELIPQYLCDVLQLIHRFSDELQLSCIYLIFNTPEFFIQDKIIEIIDVLKIAFKIGLTDPSLIYCALETLIKWNKIFNNKDLNNFYKNIVVYIEPYLISEENLSDSNQYCRENKKDKIENAIISNEKSFQKKILQILSSSLKYDTIFQNNMFLEIEESWNTNNLLFDMLFPDLHLEICLDKFIQRIKKLIETGNRRTKFSACEFLHTVITIILGKKLTDKCFNKNLCSSILKLGCDSDNVVRNLFHPLIIHLTHYLSLKPIRESRMSQVFIDSLFEGLTNELNPSLRDYCGVCLKEFVQWTIKQSPEYDPSKSSNFSNLVHRIINFALYPSNNKRLAAAIAFNHLYTTLGGSISVINIHWLEFLYVFVKCLEECDDIRIISAINNVESVIKVTANTLNAKSKQRRKPPGFANENLKSTTMWLLEQCGSVNVPCRHKCMELFESLCLLVPGNKSVEEFFTSCDINCINRIALKNLDEEFECITINNTQAFLKCLDFYIWIFNKGFLSPKYIFNVKSSEDEKNIFFNFFDKFASIIINKNIGEISKSSTSTEKEAEELINLLNKVILEIFRFISTVLLVKKNEHSTNILENLWTDNLYILIAHFTLYPQKIGLTAKILQTIKSQQLENWFIVVLENLPETYVLKLQKHFFIEKKEDYIFFKDVNDIIDFEKSIYPPKDFMRSIIIIKKCKLFNFETEHALTLAYSKDKIAIIFEALKIAVYNRDLIKRIETHIKDYLIGVIQFFLLDYQPELLEVILDFILNGCRLTAVNGYIPSHQEYFFDWFRVPIFLCIMKNPTDALKIFDRKLSDSPEDMFLIIEELMIFAKRNRSENSETLASEVIKRCDMYRALLGNETRRRDRFFNINCMAVSLMSNPMSAMYVNGSPNSLCLWILDELNTTPNLEKSTIMESFLVCMIDEAGGASPDLSIILGRLRDADSAAWLEKLRSSEVERSRAVQCLHALARLLEITRSCVVYEGIVRYAAGACELLATDSTSGSLKVYFAVISAEKVLKSLETIYGVFKESTLSSRERLDVLRYFLLPSLESCRTPVLGKFYERNARDISEPVIQDLPKDNITERTSALVTKIGCYRLFELMFCKLPPAMIALLIVDGKKTDLGLLIGERALGVRQLVPCHIDEREFIRLLHCAAFNCFVAMACSKQDEECYKAIFQEVQDLGQLIWERIIDCERSYDLLEPFHGYRWQPISIRRINDEIPQMTSYAAYFRRDSRRMSDFQLMGDGLNGRHWLGLECDELNMHECTATITGTIMYLVNSKINRLSNPDEDFPRNQLPHWLLHFCEALATNKNNVKLYLMRIIGNTKAAFMPYLKSLFVPLVRALRLYLTEKSINYLIRDMLLIIIESKYTLKEKLEVEEAQQLIEALIERVRDDRISIYEYNMEMLERLIIIWNDKLQCPKNLDSQIQESNSDMAIRIILMLFRHSVEPQVLIAKREVHAMVRRAMFQWQNSMTPRTFETLGWIMKYIEEEQRDTLIKKDLIDLFNDIQRSNVDYCARLICRLSIGCPQLGKREELRSFVDPRIIEDDECRAECLEVFLKTVEDFDPEEVVSQLEHIDLKGVLRDRILPCLNVAFRITSRLLGILNAVQLMPYAQLIEVYTTPDTLVDHKRIAYGFFMNAYENYKNIKNEESESLTKLASEVLIRGTADPSDELQEAVLGFWGDRADLSYSTVDRLQHLLSMYGPRVHTCYTQFLALMMLDLAAKSPDSERLLYGQLAQGRYEEYEVVAPRTRRRSRVRAPLFAPSLLGLLERAIAQQGSKLRRPNQEERPYEATTHMVAETSFEQLERHMSSKEPPVLSSRNPIPDPSENKLSRRIFEVSNKPNYNVSRTSAHEYFRRLRKETRLQREAVKINRRYRLGNYPDVEITQSSVVASFQGLARIDQRFAADFVVLLICALMKVHPEIQPIIDEVCSQAFQQPNEFITPALEIMLHSECRQFDSQQVANIAESMGLHASAILLIEKEIIHMDDTVYVVQPQKKLTNSKSMLQHRLQLARLYKCIGEDEIVSNIFKNWTLPVESKHLRSGYLAEEKGEWMAAMLSYEMGHENGFDFIKDDCSEGMLRCLSELSSWTEINKKVGQILNEDYNSVWQNSKNEKLIPWIFTAELQKMLENQDMDIQSATPVLELLDDWVTEKGTTLTKKFGDKISVFYLCKDHPSEAVSQRYLKRCLDYMWECWTSGNWLNTESKLGIFETLRNINDIDVYMQTLNSKDLPNAARDLISYWEEHSPDIENDFTNNLLSWNLRISYRLAFISQFVKRLKSASIELDILNNLMTLSLNQRLKVIELAVKHRNKILAKKYYLRLKILLNQMDTGNTDLLTFHHDFDFVSSKYKLLCGEMENNIQEKFTWYDHSWQLANILVSNEIVSLNTKIKVKHHIFDITQAIYNLMKTNEECMQFAIDSSFVCKILGCTSSDNIKDVLRNYSHNILKNTCNEGNNNEMAESYAKFAKYNYDRMTIMYVRYPEILDDFIESVLTAMSLGSLKTICYFPCILKYLLYRDSKQTAQLFIDKCKNVPTWMFLSWKHQIVLHLSTSLKSLVLPIVERLAKDYPNAIAYSFRGIYEPNSELRKDSSLDALFKLIFVNPKIETFFKAMRYLCQPEQYLKYNLSHLIQSSSHDKNNLKLNLSKFIISIETEMHLQGPVYKKVFTKYQEDFVKLQKYSDADDIKRWIEIFCIQLDEDMLMRIKNERSAESSRLDYYSSFLGDFSDDIFELEVPGQYLGNKRPITRHHARIARIDGFVQDVGGYLKIGFIGTDARTYDFLMMTDGNARQHQTVQHIFKTTNDILHRNHECQKRSLFINTHDVVPLSKSFSLVQWIKGTKSLKECLEFSMSNKSLLQIVSTKYQNWIEMTKDDKDDKDDKDEKNAPKSHIYKQSLLTYTATDVITKMNELTKYISWDLLRKTFVNWSISNDCFIQLRQNFVTSYATMCIIHWILGVGNRCLENIHIEVKTGKCFGNDFNMIFGTGIKQPIPELVPFRLTIQILGLLKPFQEQNVFGSTMSNVLTALINDKTLILDYLELFMHESFDWNEKLNQLWRNDDKNHQDVQWSSKRTLSIINKKLSGHKPSDIMLEELSHFHDNNDKISLQCFNLYKCIISGNDVHHETTRLKLKNTNLTPEEQVECLLDQAIDVNVLGRMSVKWHPFV